MGADGVGADALQGEEGVEVGRHPHERLADEADRQRVDGLEASAVGRGDHVSAQVGENQRLVHGGMDLAHAVRLDGQVLDRGGEGLGLPADRQGCLVELEVHGPSRPAPGAAPVLAIYDHR